MQNNQLSVVLKKSVKAILSQQKDNGAVDRYCRNRILESLLTLHLLRNQSYLPSNQKQIENYLVKAIASNSLDNYPTEIEKVISLSAQQVIDHNYVSQQISKELVNKIKQAIA